jgi:uncharacterized protein
MLILWTSLFLWGCAGAPEKDTPVATAPLEQLPEPEPDTASTLPKSRHTDIFNQAEASLATHDWQQADVTLQALPQSAMTTNDKAYLTYLEARIAYTHGDQAQAVALLDNLLFMDIHPALQYRALSFKHYILEMQGDSLASAQLADQIMRFAPRDTVAAWQRNVWLNLARADKDTLLNARAVVVDPRFKGWLELALVSRDNTYDPSAALTQWRNSHPGHPAGNNLPGGMGYSFQPSSQRDKVALLLPISGPLAPAGKAVLNGFMAGYYAHGATGRGSADLEVFDTAAYASASAAYDAAVSQGTTMIVGPLSKESLVDLGTRLERPVPVLALNRIDQILPAAGSALVQLSLSPEDEVVSAANIAYGKGARNALLITPAGDWGDKMSIALREHWTALGGNISSHATYNGYDDYSNSVKTALSLDASEQRAAGIRSIFGSDTEFTPRRRQDADVVFLFSQNDSEARSIKPLLAFHYAGDLPVFALSNVYSGTPDERNRDLNGLYLVEMPWLLGSNPGLRATITDGGVGDNYTRLHALGADAFLVQNDFQRLQAGADALFRGDTGLLRMGPDLIIRREMSLAIFDGSELQRP